MPIVPLDFSKGYTGPDTPANRSLCPVWKNLWITPAGSLCPFPGAIRTTTYPLRLYGSTSSREKRIVLGRRGNDLAFYLIDDSFTPPRILAVSGIRDQSPSVFPIWDVDGQDYWDVEDKQILPLAHLSADLPTGVPKLYRARAHEYPAVIHLAGKTFVFDQLSGPTAFWGGRASMAGLRRPTRKPLLLGAALSASIVGVDQYDVIEDWVSAWRPNGNGTAQAGSIDLSGVPGAFLPASTSTLVVSVETSFSQELLSQHGGAICYLNAPFDFPSGSRLRFNILFTDPRVVIPAGALSLVMSGGVYDTGAGEDSVAGFSSTGIEEHKIQQTLMGGRWNCVELQGKIMPPQSGLGTVTFTEGGAPGTMTCTSTDPQTPGYTGDADATYTIHVTTPGDGNVGFKLKWKKGAGAYSASTNFSGSGTMDIEENLTISFSDLSNAQTGDTWTIACKKETASTLTGPRLFGPAGSLDDLTIGGTYTGTTAYSGRVYIDYTWVPGQEGVNADKWREWHNVNGEYISAGFEYALGQFQFGTYAQGLTATFANSLGHVLGQYWTISATPRVPGTFGTPVFHGVSTLNDMATGGAFTGTVETQYTVTISDTGTPDKITYTKTERSGFGITLISPSAEIEITSDPIPLDNGVQVLFGATTGHAVGSKWTFTATVVPTATAFKCIGFKLNTYIGNTGYATPIDYSFQFTPIYQYTRGPGVFTGKLRAAVSYYDPERALESLVSPMSDELDFGDDDNDTGTYGVVITPAGWRGYRSPTDPVGFNQVCFPKGRFSVATSPAALSEYAPAPMWRVYVHKPEYGIDAGGNPAMFLAGEAPIQEEGQSALVLGSPLGKIPLGSEGS